MRAGKRIEIPDDLHARCESAARQIMERVMHRQRYQSRDVDKLAALLVEFVESLDLPRRKGRLGERRKDVVE